MNPTDDALLLRDDRPDGLTTLTLNRPGQFNSLSKDMLTALQAELDAIAACDAVRVVVITRRSLECLRRLTRPAVSRPLSVWIIVWGVTKHARERSAFEASGWFSSALSNAYCAIVRPTSRSALSMERRSACCARFT